MALTVVVETGSVVANANSYMAVADVDTAAEGTALADAWAELEDTQKNLYVVLATQYLDTRFRFYGKILDEDQVLQWPRTKNYDDKGRIIPAGTIPQQLKDAVVFLAMQMAADEEFNEADQSDRTGDIKSWSTDGLSVDFAKQDTGTATAKERQENADRYNAVFKQLFETRFPELEVKLRSIGELKFEDWVTTNRQTVVK